MPSKFTRYWKRIDNTPGSLDRINPTQFRELKKMVKEAFHAGQHESQKRIVALEELARLLELEPKSTAVKMRIAVLKQEQKDEIL